MSDYLEEIKQRIDDSEYGLDTDKVLREKMKTMSYEELLDRYFEYSTRSMWNPAYPFTDSFKWVQYGIALRAELNKRDKRGSMIL